MKIEKLSAMIESVCPIDGINSNGVIWFKDEATDEQRGDAQTLMNQYKSELE